MRALFVFLCFTSVPAAAQVGRVQGWRSDIDSLTARIDKTHPNPWRSISRTRFFIEANALRDSASTLSDARMTTGIMRLTARLGDGHTGVIDLGKKAVDQWYPVRFTLFADGLWITASDSANSSLPGNRVLSLGGVKADEVVRRLLETAQGDNTFNRRIHSGALSNRMVADGLGVARTDGSLDVEYTSGRVTLKPLKGPSSLDFEQYGEMFGPGDITKTTAFARLPDTFLDPSKNADLPLHLRGRRAYWWTYIPENRTLYFQLNSVTAKSRYSPLSLLDTWASALSVSDSAGKPVDRLVLDLRYNSGGDGTLVPSIVKALVKRDSLVRRGRFFVITSGKTFSAAADLLGELVRYANPLIVGEPAGAGMNASGDAGSIKLGNSGIVVSVSTMYTQRERPGSQAATTLFVNVPASMRGADYFAKRDPLLESMVGQPSPFPDVLISLRDSGAKVAVPLWKSLQSRYGSIKWWEPWAWNQLNSLSYDLLEAGRNEDAIAGFLINTERNPEMWEPWDSLGEAYLKVGRKAEALAAYRRAYSIDPKNWNAAEQQKVIAQLSASPSGY